MMETSAQSVDHGRRHYARWILVLTACVYVLTNYGGIRSPDNEISFRVGESLIHHGTFTVENPLEQWRGFGTAIGNDGRVYSVFSPLHPILMAPLIWAGEALLPTGWYTVFGINLPRSHYTSNGLIESLYRTPASNPQPHAVRLVVSLLNLTASVLSVWLLYLILLELGAVPFAGFVGALLFAFGTMFWTYTGSCFSELSALAFALASFLLLLRGRGATVAADAARLRRQHIAAGLFIGLSTATHITGILFVPFFLLICAVDGWKQEREFWSRIEKPVLFVFGLFVVLFLLGCYNYGRFHSFFETGRTMSASAVRVYGYGKTVAPWNGLYHLLLGSGKGLLLYSPAVLLGLVGWVHFHKRSRFLSAVLFAVVVVRLLFIATRSDWHGGFCLGPRLLLMIVPFLMIPAAFWIQSLIEEKRTRLFSALVIISVLFVTQQWAFALGDVFKHYHLIVWYNDAMNFDVFKNDFIFTDWTASPLLSGYNVSRAPFLLRWIPMNNTMLAALGFFVFAGCGALVIRKMVRVISGQAS